MRRAPRTCTRWTSPTTSPTGGAPFTPFVSRPQPRPHSLTARAPMDWTLVVSSGSEITKLSPIELIKTLFRETHGPGGGRESRPLVSPSEGEMPHFRWLWVTAPLGFNPQAPGTPTCDTFQTSTHVLDRSASWIENRFFISRMSVSVCRLCTATALARVSAVSWPPAQWWLCRPAASSYSTAKTRQRASIGRVVRPDQPRRLPLCRRRFLWTAMFATYPSPRTPRREALLHMLGNDVAYLSAVSRGLGAEDEPTLSWATVSISCVCVCVGAGGRTWRPAERPAGCPGP